MSRRQWRTWGTMQTTGVERETGAQGRSAPAVHAEAACVTVYSECEQLDGRVLQ